MPPPLARVAPLAPRPYGRMVTCCWPLGEPGTYASAFCKSGKPYCPDHVKLAYLKVRNRREDAA